MEYPIPHVATPQPHAPFLPMKELSTRLTPVSYTHLEAIGVKALKGEKGYSTLERNSYRPSFDICGIRGGYTGEG